MALCFAKSAKCANLANMAKVVNVHKIDGETFYLVRLTPQEVGPLLPDGLDAEALPEGQVFMPRDSNKVYVVTTKYEDDAVEVFSTQAQAEARVDEYPERLAWGEYGVK